MIFFSKSFVREVKKLSKKNRGLKKDVITLANQIESQKVEGDRIPGFSNDVVLKVRLQNAENKKGKSSGYIIIYCVQKKEDYYFLSIYSKNELSTLTAKDIQKYIKSMTQ